MESDSVKREKRGHFDWMSTFFLRMSMVVFDHLTASTQSTRGCNSPNK